MAQGLRSRIQPFGRELGWGLIALGAGLLLMRKPEIAAGGAALVGLACLLRFPEIGLGAALLAGPLAPLESERWHPPLPSAQVLLGLALLAWGWRGLARRDLRWPRWGWDWAYGLFLGYAFLSLAWAPAWEDGLPEWIKWAQIGLVVGLVLTASPQAQHLLLGAALLSGALQAGIGLWQAFLRGTGPEHFQLPGLPFYRAYGTFQQPNPFAGMMGLIAPVALGLGFGLLRDPQGSARGRIVGLGALGVGGLALLALAASWSRGAWLGAAAAGSVLLLMLPSRMRGGLAAWAAVLLLGLAAGAQGWIPAPIQARLARVLEEVQITDVRSVEVNEANFAVIERLAHWHAAVEMFRAHPWFGVGFGNYAAAYPAYATIRWPNPLGHAHNIYLNMAAEGGLVGLLLYLLLWIVIGIRTGQAWRRGVGWRRGLAAGLMGAWAHLHVHQLFDNLYVANLPLLIAVYGAWVEQLNRVPEKWGGPQPRKKPAGTGGDPVERRLLLRPTWADLYRAYRKEIVRFAKFCVVGTVGFAVDTGILNGLIFLGGWIPVLAKAVSFTAAVTNNFLWNRYWTYPESRSKPLWQQISQFFIVNTAGLGINLAVFGTASGWLIPRLGMKWGVNLSQGIAVGVALFWNFLANRLWTYNDVP